MDGFAAFRLWLGERAGKRGDAMAYDEALAARLRAVMAGQQDVEERRLMGTLVFMVGGHMCCGVNGRALMLRLGDEAGEPRAEPMWLGSRQTRAFWLVRGVDDPEMARLVHRAMAYVRGLDD